ncbi:MAG: hypothetical protein K940chlam1_00561 [Candidatus Anoxychlamydiales bacterium]|nr:hypothetical protein [Candidatus Anoxychlamydiales bacterium]NGX35949.1 hypothetical protein [Candidatus Anoxychlamydiales bacterium]
MASFNPWLSMWVKPKKTIQKIIEINPNFRLFFLSAIYGFISLISSSQSFTLGYHLHFLWIILISIVLSSLWGYTIFSVASFFAYFTGKWLKGAAKYQEVRSALAWSSIPMIGNLFLWILLFIVFHTALLQDFPGTFILTSVQTSFLFVVLFIQLLLSIWILVLFINALAQVQKFSIGKSILNILIAAVIFGAVFFVLSIIYFLILKAVGFR